MNSPESHFKALISPVLLVGREAPTQLNAAESVTTGPQSEVSELSKRWAYTPNPAVPEEREAEPSVYRTKSGKGSEYRSNVITVATHSSAFFPEFKPLEVNQYPDSARLGLFARGVDPEDMTKSHDESELN